MCNILEFNDRFPSDDACLDFIFKRDYANYSSCPNCNNKFSYSKMTKKKCYACAFCGNQISPLANTIFHKSSTNLRKWFFVIFLFSVSKNGVAAKEVQRQIKVTYKCALRMCHKIKELLQDKDNDLSGIVEMDETYIGDIDSK